MSGRAIDERRWIEALLDFQQRVDVRRCWRWCSGQLQLRRPDVVCPEQGNEKTGCDHPGLGHGIP
jgi:hypothetical protein